VALFAFDGTWQTLRTDDPSTAILETDSNTNVAGFVGAYESDKSFHFNGIGTRGGLLGRVLGGVFGIGGHDRMDDAGAILRGRLGPDEPVDIVGFSRGAALALAFANEIFDELAARPVRFVGLFDVVGAFGIPFNIGPLKFQQVNLGYHLALPPSVEHCYHAMALDERRHTFQLTRVAGAHEVWFRGTHSDVGGGNGNLGLNAITLRWMLRKASASGLLIRPGAIEALSTRADPLAAVVWPEPDPIRNRFRTVRPTDRVHHTVMRPCLRTAYNEVPEECPTEGAVDELRVARRASEATAIARSRKAGR